jgi:hypothetical protein
VGAIPSLTAGVASGDRQVAGRDEPERTAEGMAGDPSHDRLRTRTDLLQHVDEHFVDR